MELPRQDGRKVNDGTGEMLRIDIRSLNPIVTLHCSGNLIFGVEAETLRTMVQNRHERTIRVDLSAVDRIDASGLGLLVELQIWARETRRELTFVDLSEAVWRMVILTQLYSELDISYSGVPSLVGERDRCNRSAMIA
jgi:anti-anti-sigma factor